MVKNTKEDNEKQEKQEEQNVKPEQLPHLTLDILVGVRQLFGVAIQRGAFTEEEMKTVGGVFNYFGASVERMVMEFKEKNPEVVEKLVKEFDKQQQEFMKDHEKNEKLDTIPEEQKMPENIKNGCDASAEDIQG